MEALAGQTKHHLTSNFRNRPQLSPRNFGLDRMFLQKPMEETMDQAALAIKRSSGMLEDGRCESAVEESVASAKEAGLLFVSDDSKGITRKARGKAFQYFLPSGVALKDRAELARI